MSIDWQRLGLCLVLSLFLINVSTPLASAYSARQKEIFQQGIDFYNTEPDNFAACADDALADPPNAAAGAGVYFIGDSIGTQVTDGLQTAFSTEGSSFLGSAVAGRTLPDGLAQIDTDAGFIGTARFVVIELGTNTSGLTSENVSAMIDRVRAYAPSATIYWVDTAVVDRDSVVASFNAVNTIIHNSAVAKSYQVISWSRAVFGETADPTNMGGLIDTNNYIDTADGLNVHLTGTGAGAMTSLIESMVKSGTGPRVGGGCACSVGLLPGADNKQRIYFYLLGKGLSPPQAAGIMGNMQAESGFEPRRVQYSYPGHTFHNSRGEISRPGPTSLDDNVPPNDEANGSPGYGIVQFTSPGYKQALRDISASTGVIAGDLTLQLDYLWSVLSTTLRASVLDPILASNSSDEVADIFLVRYERPADIPGTRPVRQQFARDLLAELGPLTAPAAGASTCGSGAPIDFEGANGYVIPCVGVPAGVRRLDGPRADWTGVQDSGTIGNYSGDSTIDRGGEPIKVYIRDACESTNLKTVVVVGSIHGSENGGQLVAWELLFNKPLPPNVRIIAVPELNATGLPYTRKNANGVDLNRNNDINWGGGTPGSCSQTVPSCMFYRGPSAGSEPETQAINSFLLAVGAVNLFTIYHDNIDYVAPVGDTPVSIGDRYAALVGMHGQNSNVIGQTNTVSQSGSLDWWYNDRTGSPTLLIELSPDQSTQVIQRHVDAIVQLLIEDLI